MHGASTDQVEAIVEQKQLTPEQAEIREINSGIYAFNAPSCSRRIDQLSTDNAHGEFYLTQIAGNSAARRPPVLALRAATPARCSASIPAANWRSSMPSCASAKPAN